MITCTSIYIREAILIQNLTKLLDKERSRKLMDLINKLIIRISSVIGSLQKIEMSKMSCTTKVEAGWFILIY